MATKNNPWLDEEEAKKKQEAEESQQTTQAVAESVNTVAANPPTEATAATSNINSAPASTNTPAPQATTTTPPPSVQMTGETADAYNRYIQAMQQYGDQNHAAVKQQYDAYVNALNAAETKRQADITAARSSLEASLNEGIGGIDAILKEGDDRLKAEEQEAKDQREREEKAAIWTGVGEVAASLANLIAVGGFNAVNQQYKQYSQDWMRRAEENWRRNRDRIDRLRERQRGIQQQIIQLQMDKGRTLSSFDMNEANAQYGHANDLGKTKLDAGVTLAGIQGKANEAAAKAALEGTTAQINQDKQDAAIERENKRADAAIAQGWARINQGKAELDMAAQQNGFVPDPDRPGKYKIDKDPEVYKSAVSSGKVKPGSGGGGNWYNVTIGGQPYAINMNKETREQAMRDGKEEMKEDVRIMAGAASWDELDAGSGNNGRYQKYAAIIDALNGTGDPEEDNKVIADFYDRHRSQCERMGMHLYNVATGARQGISTGSSPSGNAGDTNQGWLFRQYENKSQPGWGVQSPAGQ